MSQTQIMHDYGSIAYSEINIRVINF